MRLSTSMHRRLLMDEILVRRIFSDELALGNESSEDPASVDFGRRFITIDS